MSYIAKIALLHRGQIIKKGAKVPGDYKRLADGIKRGWIEDTDGGPAAIPSLPPVVGDPMAEQLPSVSVEVVVPEEPPANAGPAIEDLDYLNAMAKDSLLENGIIYVCHLEKSSVESLDELRGIGVRLAERLLSDYAAYVDHSGNVVPTDPEYVSASQEDDDVKSDPEETGEAGESGEDESAEDDEA